MGLGEALIVAKIKRSNCQCDTSTIAISKLKAAKVSDAVILAMIESSETSPAQPGFSNTVISNSARASARPSESTSVPSSAVVSDSEVSIGPRELKQISEPGIYLYENGKFSVIEPAVFSGSKMNPLMGTVTFGIKKTKFRAKVRGSAANMKVAGSLPVFYFVFNPDIKTSSATMAGTLFWGLPATSPAEFMMVQMAVKQASREAVMGEFGAFTGMSMGARDKDIREYAFEKIKPGVYKVVPKVQLAPGEYCFYYAGNVTGLGFAGGKVFDFTIK